MPDKVVDVVRRWIEAFDEVTPAPEMCDPQVEISNWAESPIPGPYFGHDGVRQWWDDIADAVDSLRFKIQEIEGIDDERALTAQRIIGTFRLTGIEGDFLWGSVVSVREGKILGAVGYSSREEARQAVGRA